MARVKRGVPARKRHKKILKMAKGYYGRSGSCYRIALGKVEKGLLYAYRDRKNKKRDFRSIWIQRINAAVREYGLVYSQFMSCLRSANIKLNRKMLAEIAVRYPADFAHIVDTVKKQLQLCGAQCCVAHPDIAL